jgi:hypothetical protein
MRIATRTRCRARITYGVRPCREHDSQRVMGRTAELDRSTRLGQPQPHPMAFQDGAQGVELADVEGAFVLADHDRIHPAVLVGQELEQGRGLRPFVPRHLTGARGLEELGDEVAVPLCQFAGDVELPRPGGARVLVLGGGRPAIEDEPPQPLDGGPRVVTGSGKPLGQSGRT